jgi:uncharacterized protein (DUF433 family)
MALMIPEVEAVHLKTDPDGTVRVKATRVILDLVIEAFNDKVTAEEIVNRYDTLNLGDVYAVIGYYAPRRPRSSNKRLSHNITLLV